MSHQSQDAQQVPGGNEELLRRFVESVPAAIAMFDRDMRYLAVSRRYASDCLLDHASFLGACHYDLFPDLPERWKAAHRRALAGELVRCDEDRYDRTDGAVQWLRWEMKPWHAPDGSVGGIMVFTEDITARKQAEEALRSSEERFAKAFNVGPAGMTITRVADGKFFDANETFLNMFEFARAEVIGHTSMELKMWTPEERNRLIQRQREAGGLRSFEMTAKAKSGKLVDIVFSSIFIMLDGEDHLVTTMIDITAHKQAAAKASESQALLRAVMEGTTDAVFVKDLLGRYRFINGAAARMLGKTVDEVLGRDDAFLFGAKVGRELREDDRRVLSARKVMTYEQRVSFPAGEKVTFLSTKGPVVDAGGKVFGIFGIARDITDLKRKTEMIAGLNKCFLGFGTDHLKNISSLVRFLGAAADASFAVYGRLEKEQLVTAASWNLPKGFPRSRPLKGRVGLDLLAGGGRGSVLIKDLPGTKYAKTDPWVLQLGQRTFFGICVGRGGALVGMLWLSYREDIEPCQDTVDLVGIVAAAISGVEARLQAFEGIRRSESLLREHARVLEKKNIALGELVEHIEREKSLRAKGISERVEKRILPLLARLHVDGEAAEAVKVVRAELEGPGIPPVGRRSRRARQALSPGAGDLRHDQVRTLEQGDRAEFGRIPSDRGDSAQEHPPEAQAQGQERQPFRLPA